MEKTKDRQAMMLCTALLVGSLLAGCGASSNGAPMDTAASMTESAPASGNGVADNVYSTSVQEEAGISEGESLVKDGQAQDAGSMTLLEEKLVYHCSLEIETLDYPGTMAAIKDTIARYDGIIQSESETDKSYDWYYADYRKTGGTMQDYLEIRIPSASYESFLSELGGVGKVVSKSTSVDNISQQYYDTTAQIEALQIQERNLLTMLEKCETIEDMITVEERLTQVQYELNRMQTQKRYMDMDVAYSYVNINILEVMEYREEDAPVRRSTFIDRLGNTTRSAFKGFLRFLEAVLFLIIYLLPYLIVAAVICLVFFRRPIRKLIAYRKEAKATVRAQGGGQRQAMPAGSQPPSGMPSDDMLQNGASPDAMPINGAPSSAMPQSGMQQTGPASGQRQDPQ